MAGEATSATRPSAFSLKMSHVRDTHRTLCGSHVFKRASEVDRKMYERSRDILATAKCRFGTGGKQQSTTKPISPIFDGSRNPRKQPDIFACYSPCGTVHRIARKFFRAVVYDRLFRFSPAFCTDRSRYVHVQETAMNSTRHVILEAFHGCAGPFSNTFWRMHLNKGRKNSSTILG